MKVNGMYTEETLPEKYKHFKSNKNKEKYYRKMINQTQIKYLSRSEKLEILEDYFHDKKYIKPS